jgi:alkylated DNA nucleotide flippase Atl1
MSERVFTVTGSVATPASPISLADAGLRERSDLQEWVISHPEILGDDVLVVTFEFDRWMASTGDRERDRLDVLGIDRGGRLVIAELKRDRAPDTVEMQAIKYAAMASRFTEETLVEQFARFISRTGTVFDEEIARQRLLEHTGELDIDELRRPRIVLVAGTFTPVVTSSVVWLTEMGLDITLQRVQAYRVFDDQTVISVSQLFPVADVEEFTVSPQRAELKAIEEKRSRTREGSTVVRIVASGVLPDGTHLLLRPTTEVSSDVRETVNEWVNQDPARGRAIWHNDRRKPLEWEADGERYRPTEIVRRILAEAAGIQRSTRGPAWWVLEDGRDLPTVAGVPERGTFDWSELHEALAALPRGSWTTYGDLAAVIGTAAQPLGQHITTCPLCPNAYRVLGSDGRPRLNFAWGDSADSRTQEEALAAEGVRFANGKADQSQRLDAEALEGILITSREHEVLPGSERELREDA